MCNTLVARSGQRVLDNLGTTQLFGARATELLPISRFAARTTSVWVKRRGRWQIVAQAGGALG